MDSKWKKGIWYGLGIIVLFIGAFFLWKYKFSTLDIDSIAKLLSGLGPWAAVLGGSLIILQTFFPFIPFLVLAGANVLVFGLWGGFLVNWVSAVAGSILMFWVAKTCGRTWAEKKIQKYKKVHALNQFLHRNSFKTIFILRLFPIIPPAVMNLAAGLASVESSPFIIATLCGKIPAIFLESMLGNDLFHFADNKLRFFVILLIFAIVLWIGMKIVKKKIKLS